MLLLWLFLALLRASYVWITFWVFWNEIWILIFLTTFTVNFFHAKPLGPSVGGVTVSKCQAWVCTIYEWMRGVFIIIIIIIIIMNSIILAFYFSILTWSKMWILYIVFQYCYQMKCNNNVSDWANFCVITKSWVFILFYFLWFSVSLFSILLSVNGSTCSCSRVEDVCSLGINWNLWLEKEDKRNRLYLYRIR